MTTSFLTLFLNLVENFLTQKILISKSISELQNEIKKLKYCPGTSRKKKHESHSKKYIFQNFKGICRKK